MLCGLVGRYKHIGEALKMRECNLSEMMVSTYKPIQC
jgi:hypothetical protein